MTTLNFMEWGATIECAPFYSGCASILP
jgi:hypothetical protein